MEKGFYWVAVGLLVLGVNQSLVKRHGAWLGGMERNSVAQLEQFSHRAWDHLQGRNSAYELGELAGLDQLDRLDRLQSMRVDFASHNAELAQRREAWVERRIEMVNRMESRRAEWMAHKHPRVFRACPPQDIGVSVPPISVPAVHVTVSDDGTI